MGKLCRNGLILLALAALAGAEDQSTHLFEQGLTAQRSGDILHAYLLFARAAVLNPSNKEIAEHKASLAALAAKTATIHDANTRDANTRDANTRDANTGDAEPDQDLALLQFLQRQQPAQYDEFGPTAPVPHLTSTGIKKAFNLNSDATATFQKVGEAFGVQMIFETEYRGPAAFPFRTGELDMFEAFRLLESMTNSLVEPIDDKTAMVVRDTPQRRAEVIPVIVLGIPIPERFAVQDAQELLTAVQQALEIRRAGVDPGRHMVYFRDSVSKVLLARQLFADLSRLRAQVEIEVQLLTVTKNSSRNIGFQLPSSSALVNLGNFLHQTISPAGFTQFLTFGGGKTLFGLGVTGAQAFATMTESSTESLLTAQVTAIDGQPAALTVGTRYPVATAQYVGAAGGVGGTLTTPTPTITFQDLGLVMKITPTVHDAGEMTLDIDAAFTTLGATGADGIPAIAQRKFQGKVRLGQDEWAVIAGLTQTNDAVNKTGIAGLASIPLLGRLFRVDDTEKDLDETLIVLKPRIVNLPPWDFPTTTKDVGTEGRFISLY